MRACVITWKPADWLLTQTNEYLKGQGAAGSEPVTNPTPCTAATFLTMLETGIYLLGPSDPLRAQYIEVFHDKLAVCLTAFGEFQFNVVIPSGTPDGDQLITATYNGLTTQTGTLITVHH